MNGYNVLKYGATGIAAPDMRFYDRLRAEKVTAGLPVRTITGVPPLTFRADGSPLSAWTIYGNGQQDGTPTPDAPIYPDFVGTLSDGIWTVPISCGGQTVKADLLQVKTVRMVKKKVFTGDPAEDWHLFNGVLYSADIADYLRNQSVTTICSHYPSSENSSGVSGVPEKTICMGTGSNDRTFIRDSDFSSAANFRAFLAEQYQNGTPLTLWYVMDDAETGIVNEPLCKIDNYADELHITNEVTIQTVRGSNVLTVGTTVPPSEMTITGHIKPL